MADLDSPSVHKFFGSINKNMQTILSARDPDAVWNTEVERYAKISPDKFFFTRL